MKYQHHFIYYALILSFFAHFFTQPTIVKAEACKDGGYYKSISCNFPTNGESRSKYPLPPNQKLTCTITGLNNPSTYKIELRNNHWSTSSSFAQSNSVSISSAQANDSSTLSNFELVFPTSEYNNNGLEFNVNFIKDGREVCKIAQFTLQPEYSCNIRVSQERDFINPAEKKICYAPSCMDATTETYIEIKVTNKYGSVPYKNYNAKVEGFFFPSQPSDSGVVTLRKRYEEIKEHRIIVEHLGSAQTICSSSFVIADRCSTTDRSTCDAEPPPEDSGNQQYQPFKLCTQIRDATQRAKCETCTGEASDPTGNPQGVWTAIGCISTKPENMMAHFIRLGVGMGGGISLLMVLIGGFLLTTSQGNPKQQDQAKEMVTSAVIGLLFVLFSVVLLQFIGVTILQIPGFGAVIK